MNVAQKCSRSGSDATEKMKKQARTRMDQRSELDIGRAVKPVKKASDRLTKEEKEFPEIRTYGGLIFDLTFTYGENGLEIESKFTVPLFSNDISDDLRAPKRLCKRE